MSYESYEGGIATFLSKELRRDGRVIVDIPSRYISVTGNGDELVCSLNIDASLLHTLIEALRDIMEQYDDLD